MILIGYTSIDRRFSVNYSTTHSSWECQGDVPPEISSSNEPNDVVVSHVSLILD